MELLALIESGRFERMMTLPRLVQASPALQSRLLSYWEQEAHELTLAVSEDYDLVARQVYAAVPPRVDYELTTTGRSAAVPLASLRKWAERHLDSVE